MNSLDEYVHLEKSTRQQQQNMQMSLLDISNEDEERPIKRGSKPQEDFDDMGQNLFNHLQTLKNL